MVPKEDPIVQEISDVLREWSHVWKRLYAVSSAIAPGIPLVLLWPQAFLLYCNSPRHSSCTAMAPGIPLVLQWPQAFLWYCNSPSTAMAPGIPLVLLWPQAFLWYCNGPRHSSGTAMAPGIPTKGEVHNLSMGMRLVQWCMYMTCTQLVQ